jgi:hypothetical protein
MSFSVLHVTNIHDQDLGWIKSDPCRCRNIPLPPGSSVLPEHFESVRRQLRVTNCVLDALVPKVVLQCARVMAVVGELVAAGVTQHMWVNGKVDACILTGAFDELSRGVVCDWLATFRHEQVRRSRTLDAGDAERVLRASQWVRGRCAAFEPDGRAVGLGQVPLGSSAAPLPLTREVHGDRRPESMWHHGDRGGLLPWPL